MNQTKYQQVIKLNSLSIRHLSLVCGTYSNYGSNELKKCTKASALSHHIHILDALRKTILRIANRDCILYSSS